MKAKIIHDGLHVVTAIMDKDSTEYDARQALGIDGIYHKRAGGLWIVVKP